ncbi:heterokaryon incompatibility protein-domain-containing protein [Massariosphaeria phaeospora]|uniref:Heterokaryon incompatibility protein-domain-containing protein n=1 Tax=Massariosphaeria phaeospora TaxID=100035 RepID=A0A7C8IKB2_9PLEO|nr:heterokaryon incompatibility protein-domain-containing protein [Massariosphaeria phaeospora]
MTGEGKREGGDIEDEDAGEVRVAFTSTTGSALRVYRAAYQYKEEEQLEIFVVEPHKLKLLPVSTSVSGYTGSESSYNKAVSWFTNCLTTHKMLCPGLTPPAHLPRRVLDLSPSSPHPNDCIQLRESVTETAYYACLSHCWGDSQPLRTTLHPDTYTQHRLGIPISALPRTFQDTVVFTRSLSIRYLWIDSLCIIQDSPEDWAAESVRMAEIYQNAIITLAASAAPGSQHGLFKETQEAYQDRSLAETTGRASHDAIRIRSPLLHRAPDHPLLTRAWVFQERMLSARVLHFGPQELIWECYEDAACECGSFSKRTGEWPKGKAWLAPRALGMLSEAEMTDWWHGAVADYSLLGLTREGDVLPAISGVAKKMQAEAKEAKAYVAGLWRASLPLDLCWATQRGRLARRPDEWRAPSWSWASVVASEAGGVDYALTTGLKIRMQRDADTVAQHVRVIEAQCVPKSISCFGQLKDGYIVLLGTLSWADLVRLEDSTRSSNSGVAWSVVSSPDSKQPLAGVLYPDYDYSVDGPHHVTGGTRVPCLKMFSITKTVSGSISLYLVLRVAGDARGVEKKEKGDDEVVFERIGLLYAREVETGLEDVSDVSARVGEGEAEVEVEVKII